MEPVVEKPVEKVTEKTYDVIVVGGGIALVISNSKFSASICVFEKIFLSFCFLFCWFNLKNSGLAGLTAAFRMVNLGKKVLLCDAYDVGGRTRSKNGTSVGGTWGMYEDDDLLGTVLFHFSSVFIVGGSRSGRNISSIP